MEKTKGRLVEGDDVVVVQLPAGDLRQLGDGGRKYSESNFARIGIKTGLRIMPKPKMTSRSPAIQVKKLQFRFANLAGIGLLTSGRRMGSSRNRQRRRERHSGLLAFGLVTTDQRRRR